MQTRSIRPSILFIALAAAYPVHAQTGAGIAQFTSGDVSVRRGSALSPLAKGQTLESGDGISTGQGGRVQLRFSDGGIVSLQPNTQFNVTRYADTGDPARDSFFVNFVRGGMRAITGLIGKRNRENYKVQTATATIGIRGSGFSAAYNPDGSISVSTELDEIEVCTRAGCVRLTAGESCLIVSQDEVPVRNQVRADLPTPAPMREITVAGDKATTFSGIVTGLSARLVNGNNTITAINGTGSSTFKFENNQLLEVVDNPSTGHRYSSSSATAVSSLGTVQDSDYLGWGYWASGSDTDLGYTSTSSLTDLHYLVGRPTSNMPTSGTASYVFGGGTAPTSTSGGAGILTGGSLSVDFGALTGTAQVGTRFSGVDYALSQSINISGATFSGSNTSPASQVSGFFTGSGASRAGMVYKFDSQGAPGTISGAIAYTKN